MKRLQLAFCRHDWEGGLPSGHSWCRRCERYDDDPAVVRRERFIARARNWSPVWGSVTKRDLTVRIGQRRRFPLSATARLHTRFDRQGELPGLGLTIELWRLTVYASLGHGWQDEDSESRSLMHLSASVNTYGLRWIGCWFGHSPQESQWSPGYVSCVRCDETLETPRGAS